ncbi:MAG: S41 family peptidase [Fimbriimonadales bacterium]
MIISVIAAMSLGQAVDARLMRFPDIHGDRTLFTYAGDIWTVSAEGGVARKLTNHAGNEALGKFSTDGAWIAFTASYDGNADVYVMRSEGSEPRRLTFHPDADVVLDWMPDGKSIMFRSSREAVSGRYQGAFTVPMAGGTPQALPMKESGLASACPDGTKFAYNRMPTENAAWKRYRGGLQSFISFYDAAANKYWEMEHDESAYLWPMWVDHRVYYANDSDGRYNLYSFDTRNKSKKQLTNYKDFDIKWPSYGSGKIAFEQDAKLWIYDIQSDKVSNLPVQIHSDLLEARPYRMELGNHVGDLSISPSGVRVALEARGEVFSVPVKEGLTQNLTQTPGARERYPNWSPDGQTILYASDRSGEYEFCTQKSDGSGEPVRITTGLKRFVHSPTWSPDSKKFFYTDASNSLFLVNVATKKNTKIGGWDYPAFNDTVWSPDSKWIAYSKSDSAGFGKIYMYSIETGKETKVSQNIFGDNNPVFDADGKYLFFVSTRDFNPTMGIFELRFNMVDGQRIYGYTLRKDAPSPFAPKNEMEKIGIDKPAPEKQPDDKAEAAPAPKPYDLTDMDTRLFSVPVSPGSYGLAGSASGKLFYFSNNTVFQFDLAQKKADAILEGAAQISFTPKMDKMAYQSGATVGVIPLQPGQKIGAGQVNLADMETVVDPKAEWKQSFWEAWRFERDYFWNPNMGGLNWKAIGDRYAQWLPNVAHRSDLDYLLRELLGELGTGHAYVIPAPLAGVRSVPIGLLGADYERTAQGVRFKKVYRGHMWDSARRAPLNEPGMNVGDGDYLLEIDGQKIGPNTNVDELLVGKADKNVEITVNSTPSTVGSRKILVKPIGDEGDLRYADWLDTNRKYVDEKTNGRVAYVHVPSTGMDGVIEFYKMFYPQVDKEAIIVDERYNSGGFIPDFFVETLDREPLVRWSPRDMGDFRSPGAAVIGPKVMLINHYGGSGGDAFPYFFKKKKLGPVIGTRTWGGLVGITGGRDLMAGGAVTIPQFAIWDVENGKSKWVVENVGVPPDIKVDNTPDQVLMGKDPQLDKAIAVIMEALRKNPPAKPAKPPYPGGGGSTTAD